MLACGVKTKFALVFVVATVFSQWAHPSVIRIKRVSEPNEQPAFPIDAVFTWVDSSDRGWQQSVETYLGANSERKEHRYPHPQHADAELKLSVGLAIRNLPWLRYIYIVTTRPHYREWWESHRKIRVVYHDELTEIGLPTFNSNAIELFSFNISNLSEHFIYFNDDFYVLQPVNKSLFFSVDGRFHSVALVRPFGAPALAPFYTMYSAAARDEYAGMMQRVAKALNVARILVPRHVPYALTRSALRRATIGFEDWVDTTARTRFRSAQDFHLLSMVINQNGRLLDPPPSFNYVSPYAAATPAALIAGNPTFATFNNPATEENYQVLAGFLDALHSANVSV